MTRCKECHRKIEYVLQDKRWFIADVTPDKMVHRCDMASLSDRIKERVLNGGL